MPLADHAPAALRGVATTASWFVIIASLWVADKNRRPNAFAVLVWLAALSALAASMVGCFSFFASQKLERCRHFMAASAAFSGFWLFVALLTPTKQRDLGKDGLALGCVGTERHPPQPAADAAVGDHHAADPGTDGPGRASGPDRQQPSGA